MIGTNTQIILKMDASKTGPAVELISMGSIGSECKLAGVRTWHRIPSFKNLEWTDVSGSALNEPVWIEILDGARLIKTISSLISLASVVLTSSEEDVQCEINVQITNSEFRLSHGSKATFSLPVRWFDAKWAAATIVLPPASFPGACVKLVAGLDQIAAILKRIDRWRDDWYVDTLSVHVNPAENGNGLWDVEFVAETSTPPHLKLSAILPHCPEYQIKGGPQFQACKVSVGLRAATRALIIPLAENGRLSVATSGIILSWILDEALVCHINWASLGCGPITTTIYIPCRVN